MRNLKISVVMPSFNQVDFIEEAIESVLNQTYRNFELIIVDGLSNNGTIDKILKYKNHEKVKKIIIEKDKGQTDALYKGFQHCSGEIYAWLNSDDVFLINAFQRVVEEFIKHPEIDVLNGELNVIDDKSRWIATWPRKKITSAQWMHYPQTIGQPSTFFTSEIFWRVGGINPKLNYAMDYDLFFRFALSNAKIHFIDDHISSFRVHNQSKTIALPTKFWKEEIKVFYTLSNKKIISGFYYWKFRGIIDTMVKHYILKSRKF